jgi:hypothetical protein
MCSTATKASGTPYSNEQQAVDVSLQTAKDNSSPKSLAL